MEHEIYVKINIILLLIIKAVTTVVIAISVAPPSSVYGSALVSYLSVLRTSAAAIETCGANFRRPPGDSLKLDSGTTSKWIGRLVWRLGRFDH